MGRPGRYDGNHVTTRLRSATSMRLAALRIRARPEVALLAGLALVGCASPLQRPEIAAPTPTGPIDAAVLVGSWSCRDLNPLPTQPLQTVTTIYAADGSFLSVSEIVGRGLAPPIRVSQAGRWSVDGDRLLTGDVRTTARAVGGDPETDALLQAGAELVDQVGGDQKMASVILSLNPGELVLRPAEIADPPVVGCKRLGQRDESAAGLTSSQRPGDQIGDQP